MTDTLIAALIGVAGTASVGIVSVVLQHRTSLERLKTQIEEEERARRRERYNDRLLTAISGALAASDPQSKGMSYSALMTHLHAAEVLLDVRDPYALELCGALTHLGLALNEYHPVSLLKPNEKLHELRNLLEAQSRVTEAARCLFHESEPLSVPLMSATTELAASATLFPPRKAK